MNDQDYSDEPKTSSDSDTCPPTPTECTQPKGQISGNGEHGTRNDKKTANILTRELNWVEGFQLAFSAILAVVGIVALIVYSRQLNAMRSQQSTMEQTLQTMFVQTKAMQAQLLTMNNTYTEIRKQTGGVLKSADAAQRQISLVQRQFQMDQRPYVTVTILKARLDANKPALVDVSFQNGGKSRASGIAIHSHIVFGEQGAQQIRREDATDKPSADFLDPGGPHATRTIVSIKDTYAVETIDYPSDQIINWNGSDGITVFGRITYQDGFGVRYCTGYLFAPVSSGNWATTRITINGTPKKEIDSVDLCPKGTITQ